MSNYEACSTLLATTDQETATATVLAYVCVCFVIVRYNVAILAVLCSTECEQTVRHQEGEHPEHILKARGSLFD